ncbi:MAG: hypothetical protein HY341_02285 [Candidatus Kerfeldbacteria bacterium]|nr:hypothetical protein [Candidatus Kerfeldbacteria bacterium]
MQRKKKRYDSAADRTFPVECGLQPPPTDSSIRDMAVYIWKGGLPFGSTQATRIELLKEAQEHWIGSKVKHSHPFRQSWTGTVRYVRARSRSRIRARVEGEQTRVAEYGGPKFGISPHELVVKWDHDPISRLESPANLQIAL